MSTSKDSSTPDSPEESAHEAATEQGVPAKASAKNTYTTSKIKVSKDVADNPDQGDEATDGKTEGSTDKGARDKGATDTDGKTEGSTDKGAENKGATDKGATDKGAKDRGSKDKETTPTKKSRRRNRGDRPQPVPGLNPAWWAPVMCTLMVVGLLWIVVFYLLSNGTADTWPIPGIGYGNLVIGFGLIMGGFLMTTRWK